MADYSNELIAKLKKAQSVEEVTGLLKADGQDDSQAEKIWKELETLFEKEGKELSLDELEAVAGGRDWLEKGCSATVEPDSDCWKTDGGCSLCNIEYTHMPCKDARCPKCGGYVYYEGEFYYPSNSLFYTGRLVKRYICRKCGKYEIEVH